MRVGRALLKQEHQGAFLINLSVADDFSFFPSVAVGRRAGEIMLQSLTCRIHSAPRPRCVKGAEDANIF